MLPVSRCCSVSTNQPTFTSKGSTANRLCACMCLSACLLLDVARTLRPLAVCVCAFRCLLADALPHSIYARHLLSHPRPPHLSLVALHLIATSMCACALLLHPLGCDQTPVISITACLSAESSSSPDLQLLVSAAKFILWTYFHLFCFLAGSCVVKLLYLRSPTCLAVFCNSFDEFVFSSLFLVQYRLFIISNLLLLRVFVYTQLQYPPPWPPTSNPMLNPCVHQLVVSFDKYNCIDVVPRLICAMLWDCHFFARFIASVSCR